MANLFPNYWYSFGGALYYQISIANSEENIIKAYTQLKERLMENHDYVEDLKVQLIKVIEQKSNGKSIAEILSSDNGISEIRSDIKYKIINRDEKFYFEDDVINTLRDNPIYWQKLHDLIPSISVTTSKNGIYLIQKGSPEIYKLKILDLDLRIYGYKDALGDICFSLIQNHGVNQSQVIKRINASYNKQWQAQIRT